jgi:hypothetical protein
MVVMDEFVVESVVVLVINVVDGTNVECIEV